MPVEPLAGGASQHDSTLGQALTPTLRRGERRASGNRSLILAQGAKIDCAGDTASTPVKRSIHLHGTKNVYSDDGRLVLIERGSQINSQYARTSRPGKSAYSSCRRASDANGVTVEIGFSGADALDAWASAAT